MSKVGVAVMVAVLALLGVTPGTAVAAVTLEAENAALTGGAAAETEHAGYSGTGYVGQLTDANRGRAAVTFTVNAPGAQTLALRYANGTGSPRTLSVYVGAQRLTQLTLPATGGWAAWGTASATATLPSGNTAVSYRFDTADSGNVNLDRLTVTAGAPAEPGTLEAENAALAGGAAIETEHAGYSGTGYVGQFTDANKGRAAVTFGATAARAGTHRLELRYANGTGATMTLSVYVGSQRITQLSLPATGGWATWGTAATTATLPAGTSQVGYRFDTTDSGNVNLDRLTVTAENTDPVACGAAPPSICFEAETAFLAGGTARGTSTAGFSGTGYATGFTSDAARLVVPVGVGGGQQQTVTVRYTAAQSQAVVLTANGLRLGQLTLAASSGWADATQQVTLPAGVGSIGLSRAPGSGGNFAVDRVVLSNGKALAARGATVPYTEYEAENASTNGAVFGPDRTFRTVPAEASGRRGVRLAATGNYVEFTLTQPANSLVVRASIPDTSDGAGQTAPIAVYANGTKVRDLELSSVYSWVYGAYPYNNNPGDGGAQRFFGESRTLLDPLPAGTKLRLQKDSSSVSYYDIDLIDTETVGTALPMPSGYVNVTQHGATPNDTSDDTTAIRNAVNAARAAGTGVWVPSGTFVMADRVDLQAVAVRGAGPWYSVLKGRSGKGGFFATGGNVTIADLMIDGDVRYRDDANFHAALEGNFGTGSLIQNVWVERTKVGLWADDGTDGLLALGLRIRNTFADGVNFNGNVRDTSVSQSVIRNTGDDALAMWSQGSPVTRGSFDHNTVQIPMLGNGVGIYGGTANRAEDNVISDTLTASAGIAVGTRFNPVPLSGDTLIQRNTLVRTGGLEPNWNSQLGALWIYADTADITSPVIVRDVEIRDSTYAGILVSWQRRVDNVTFDRVTVNGAGTYGIEVNAAGRGQFTYVTVSGAASGGLSLTGGFEVVRGPGNSGF